MNSDGYPEENWAFFGFFFQNAQGKKAAYSNMCKTVQSKRHARLLAEQESIRNPVFNRPKEHEEVP